MEVIKASGKAQAFDIQKIISAIERANKSVPESSRIDSEMINKVIENIKKMLAGFNSISVDDIHDIVERSLMKYVACYDVGKAYITYRAKKKAEKKFSTTEEQILAVVDGSSTLRGDNANKRIDVNSSIRDYIAGVSCKEIANKILPKDISSAHKKGLIHWHDADYSPVMPLHNCDLINVEDMFTNGFMMGDTKIEPNEDTPFETACNLLAQINLQVSGSQYGGQTVSWAHLLPFIANSRRLITEQVTKELEELKPKGFRKLFYKKPDIEPIVEKRLRAEIYKGVKTYQYQVLCHSSSNGQTPFVSNNLCLREAQTQQELDDFAMLIEEILKRRIKGVKDKSGHYIAPLFPKLLYWTCDGLNVKENDPYFYLTKLAAQCELLRTQPDIVSESQTRKAKQGQIIPSMGCRSLLGPIWEKHSYPITTKFHWCILEDMLDTPEEINYQKIPYLNEACSLESLKNGKYFEGKVFVNFRGNPGWVLEKTDLEVTILEPKVYGRWNNGVITINLPHVALEAREKGGDIIEEFYKILDTRLALVRKGLQIRNEYCRKIKAKNSPILWEHGALARLDPELTVGDLMDMYPTRNSISIGFVGMFETCQALIGQSNTSSEGQLLSIKILSYLNACASKWKSEDEINYSIYGTPEESLTYKFALANRRDFGTIDKITDKDYVVNSYHVDPREEIDAFTKIAIEGKYLALSSGGAVSYVEIIDDNSNPEAIIAIIQWMNDHIIYAEFNKKLAVCYECGHEGGIKLTKTENGEFKFICPICGNSDDSKMSVTARLCGYLGKVNAGNTNKGRLDDIYHRVVHTDCKEEWNENQSN